MFRRQGKGQRCHNGFGNRASQGRGLGRQMLNEQVTTEKEAISFGQRDGSGAGAGCGKRANKNTKPCQGNGKGLGLGNGRGKAHNRTFEARG